MDQNLGLIIAIVGSAVGIVAVVVMLFLWLRAEGNADRRDSIARADQYRRETIDLIEAIRIEVRDFHNRLYSLEEKRTKIIK